MKGIANCNILITWKEVFYELETAIDFADNCIKDNIFDKDDWKRELEWRENYG